MIFLFKVFYHFNFFLHLQKWNEFVNSTEEKQQEMIAEAKAKRRNELSKAPLNRRLNVALRNLLRKKNLPIGMLQYLEQEVVSFFSAMPTQTYISPALSSFERLLLHSVSDYHQLMSLSKFILLLFFFFY